MSTLKAILKKVFGPHISKNNFQSTKYKMSWNPIKNQNKKPQRNLIGKETPKCLYTTTNRRKCLSS